MANNEPRKEIKASIKELMREAAEAGDFAQVAMCNRIIGYELYDSETGALVPPEPGTLVEYVEVICESLGDDTADELVGHVYYLHHKVYAY